MHCINKTKETFKHKCVLERERRETFQSFFESFAVLGWRRNHIWYFHCTHFFLFYFSLSRKVHPENLSKQDGREICSTASPLSCFFSLPLASHTMGPIVTIKSIKFIILNNYKTCPFACFLSVQLEYFQQSFIFLFYIKFI